MMTKLTFPPNASRLEAYAKRLASERLLSSKLREALSLLMRLEAGEVVVLPVSAMRLGDQSVQSVDLDPVATVEKFAEVNYDDNPALDTMIADLG